MILIDALFINRSGGRVLLEYFVKLIEKEESNIFYLFDDRITDKFDHIPHDRKIFLKANLYNRIVFYRKNKYNFEKVFCFANIPPQIRMPCKVVVFFQNLLLAKQPKSLKYSNKIKLKLKGHFIRKYRNNCDLWILQSQNVKKILVESFKVDETKCKIVPFFDVKKSKIKNKVKNSFIYVSEGETHKNHLKLLSAWEILFNRNLNLELNLTVSREYTFLCQKIDDLKKKGINIINHGFISKEKINQLYERAEYLIFPSLLESFGLALIEAHYYNCKVIASDLPYVDAIISPSAKFNPYDSKEISKLVEFIILTGRVKESKLKIKNEINSLINIIVKR